MQGGGRRFAVGTCLKLDCLTIYFYLYAIIRIASASTISVRNRDLPSIKEERWEMTSLLVRRFSRDANDRFPEVLKIKDGFEGAANATDWKLLRVPLP